MCRGREFLLTERKQRSAYVSGSGVPRREDCAKTHQKVRNNILFSYQPPPPEGGEGNKQADSRLPNPQFLVPGRGGRIRGNSGFPGPDPRFPQTRPIRGLGRKRPNSSLENRPPIFVLFGKSVNFPLAGRPISLVARQNSVQTGVFRCEIPLSIWRPMQTCVGTAKTSSPTENSARHTFQDRAYPYGRNARKRTKKSGIIYCLVTSHPW